MNAHQAVNDWLSKINPNDKGLTLDKYGQCPLTNGDGEVCTLLVPAANSTAFTLYADLWLLPNETDAATYESLLSLNLLGIKTLGCILGLDKQMRSLVFSYSRDISATDIKTFCTVIENFFTTAADVKKQLAAVFKSDAKPGASKAARMSPLHKSFRQISS